MQTITIRIPARATAKDPIAIEWLDWKNGSCDNVRPRKLKAPPGLLGASGTALKKIKQALASASVGPIQAMGRELARAISGSLLEQVDDKCRIYLDIEDPALTSLPWEILYGRLPFALDPKCYLVRCSTPQLEPAPPRDRRPLKVLVVISLPKNEDVGGYAEAAALKRLFWRFDHSFDCVLVDTSERPLPNRESIKDLLNEHTPDILHFIGHANPSQLLLDRASDGKATWPWTAADIRLTLRESFRPRVVYLNACRTHDTANAEPNRAGQFDMGSVASAFLIEGSLAAISMQGDVNGKAATAAAKAFYEALGQGESLEAAVRALRNTIADQAKECYFPVLTVAAAADSILPERAALDRQRSRSLDASSQMKQLSTFIDRHQDRRILIRNFLQTGIAEKHRYSAALVQGNSLTGKTCFCFWWIRMCVWQNMLAYYIIPNEVQDLRNFNWLESVHQICEGKTAMGELSPPLPGDAVKQFYWEMEEIIDGKGAPFDAAPSGFKPRRRQLQDIYSGGRAGNDFAEKVLGAFHDALKRAAGTDKLVLVFDHWIDKAQTGSTDVEVLKTYLLDPIAADADGPIRVIVVSGPAAPLASAAGAAGVQFNTNWHTVNIDDFDMRDMRDLMIEFVERYAPQESTSVLETLPRAPKKANPNSSAEPKSPRDAVTTMVSVMQNVFGLAIDQTGGVGK